MAVVIARIPPVVAALAAALDAHEWRLAGRYNIEKGREVQRRAIAALNATTIAREEMLRETALQATEGSDAIASLAWLSDKCHDRARDLRLTADGMRARRAAAYLRWCVRRLRGDVESDGLTYADRVAGWEWKEHGGYLQLYPPWRGPSIALVTPEAGWAHGPVGAATIGTGGKETGRAGQRAVCASLREAGALRSGT